MRSKYKMDRETFLVKCTWRVEVKRKAIIFLELYNEVRNRFFLKNWLKIFWRDQKTPETDDFRLMTTDNHLSTDNHFYDFQFDMNIVLKIVQFVL